jgi:hypothetical protein
MQQRTRGRRRRGQNRYSFFLCSRHIDRFRETNGIELFVLPPNAIILWFSRNLSERLSCDLSTHDSPDRTCKTNERRESSSSRADDNQHQNKQQSPPEASRSSIKSLFLPALPAKRKKKLLVNCQLARRARRAKRKEKFSRFSSPNSVLSSDFFISNCIT